MLTYDAANDDEHGLEHALAARELFRTLGNSSREVDMLNAIGWYAARSEDYQRAREHCQAALELAERVRALLAASVG
jgi:hypothetical protein